METIELVEVVDSSGAVVARLPRTQAIDDHPDYHLQIVVVVITDLAGNVLLSKRSLAKTTAAGLIEIPGGGLRAGGDIFEEACREVREEVGITLQPEELELVSSGINANKRWRYLLKARTALLPKADFVEVEW